VICAHEARWQLELDSVVLMPVGEAPHKEIVQDAGREARYGMCRLSAEADEWLSASRHEVDQEGPSYTVETLRALRYESPGDDFFLIMGGDAAADLASWREPDQVLALATVAVAEREGAQRRQVMSAISGLEGSEGVRFFSMPTIEISSTMVRGRVADGAPIRHLVPDPVATYIEEAGLYGVGSALEGAGGSGRGAAIRGGGDGV
jgi:nicotinate-nucleotide adenylyltransferase